jgi:hypothetical protein
MQVTQPLASAATGINGISGNSISISGDFFISDSSVVVALVTELRWWQRRPG